MVASGWFTGTRKRVNTSGRFEPGKKRERQVRERRPITLGRRGFLALALGGSASCALQHTRTPAAAQASDDASHHQAWERAALIRRQIQVPQFPDRDFNIAQFGAVADGETDNTQAIAKAIDACHAAGGGRVLVPEGRFLTGPIHLKSNVNLHLADAARLLFVTDPKAYLPAVFTRWEGVELMGYSPLIYAFGQSNIAITGKGVLDGQANKTTWWPWKGGRWVGGKDWSVPGYPTQDEGRDALFADMEKGVDPRQRLYAEGANLRPPFIQPYQCENVLIEGVTIVGAPFWLINPVLCQSVTVRGVTCASLGPNSDGCNPESCKNVQIQDCFFDTGDDCIAIKSGRNADGRRLATPSENIVISGCKMRTGHGGVVIGSEISGGARNIFVEDCEFNSPKLLRGIRLKTNAARGGFIENFYIRNITIGEVQNAIDIDFHYEEGEKGEHLPRVNNLEIRNLQCARAIRVFQVRGFKSAPIRNLRLINAEFTEVTEVGTLEHVENFVARNVTIAGKAFEV